LLGLLHHDQQGDLMSDLVVPQSTGLFPSRIDRVASRELERIGASKVVAAARESAKVEIVAEVTETALLAASHVAAVEALLVARTPHAEGRLRHIADAGCIGMTDIVIKAGRRVS
jgi:hypothetical protein